MVLKILPLIFLLLAGCSSNSNLLKGELYHTKHITKNNKEIEHKIKLKEKEFYQFTLYFDLR